MDYITKQVSILEKRTEAVDAVERNQLSAEFCDTMVGFIKFFLYKRNINLLSVTCMYSRDGLVSRQHHVSD